MTETLPANRDKTDTCPNCQNPVYGQFCFNCGQNQRGIDRFFFSLANEFLDDIFSFRSRASTTLYHLILHPGFLTREYVLGHRARYVPPLRLYLIASILFFSLLTLQNFISGNALVIEDDNGEIADTELTQEQRAELGLDKLNISFLSPDENQALRDRLTEQIEKAGSNPTELADHLIDFSSPLMFFLVPMFALFLKLFYPGRFYTEHLILSVHNQSFLFITLLVSNSLELIEETPVGFLATLIGIILALWIPIYFYLSLKKNFNQSHLVTVVKFAGLQFLYVTLFLFGLAVTLLLGLLTL